MVIYKAFYENFEIWVRPVKIFIQEVEMNGKIQEMFEFAEDASSCKILNKNIRLLHNFIYSAHQHL